MVNFLSVLVFLFSLNSFAAVLPSGVPNVGSLPTLTTPAGNAQVGLSDIGYNGEKVFMLSTVTTVNAVANGNHPFTRDGSATIYTVPAATSTYCFSGVYAGDTANAYWQLMSATASFTAGATSGSLTGGIFQAGASANYFYRVIGTLDQFYPVPMTGYRFLAGSFPGIQSGGTTGVRVILNCFEKAD